MIKIILSIVCIGLTTSLFAQEFKPGKLKIEDLKITTEVVAGTSAIFLQKNRETFFNVEDDIHGWLIIDRIHKVIKILEENGKEYGTETIRLFRQPKQEMTIDHIAAYTYSVVNGKLVKTKIKKESIFETELSDEVIEISIAAPSIEVGSVIEFYYEVTSPFMHIEDLVFQEDIPVQSYYAKVGLPEFFEFNRYVKGYANVSPKEYYESRSVSFSSEDKNSFGVRTQRTDLLNIKFSQVSSEYRFKDIRPLDDEPYVNEMNNYRFSVVHELSRIKNFAGEDQKYSQSWEEVAEQINTSQNFGIRLDRTGFLDEDGERFRESELSQEARMHQIFSKIQNHFAWNGKSRLYTEETLRKAYKDKTGSSAEINLTLVALLDKAGLIAYPVIASTKENGIPLFPTLDGFNYVLAAVAINGKYVLLDATDKKTVPGILPTRVINWEGRLVKSDGSSSAISLYPNKHAKVQSFVKASISPEGTVMGKANVRYTLNRALDYRSGIGKFVIADQEAALAKQFVLEEVKELKLSDKDLNKPVSSQFSFQCENCIETIDEKIIVSPRLFFGLKESPFKGEQREFPMDFGYPFIMSESVTIEIPEGYRVESVPPSTSFAMPENIAKYTLKISRQNSSLQIVTSFEMNRTLLAPDNYGAIKEFYSQILAKEKEKLVLVKL